MVIYDHEFDHCMIGAAAVSTGNGTVDRAIYCGEKMVISVIINKRVPIEVAIAYVEDELDANNTEPNDPIIVWPIEVSKGAAQ